MQNKTIKSKGEVDYDYNHDILFFKASEKDYLKSIELDNMVVDVDKQGHITGVQIFEASKFLNVKKDMLLKILQWEFKATVNDGKIVIRLTFQVMARNKIIEKHPIIMQLASESLPDSELVCEAGR